MTLTFEDGIWAVVEHFWDYDMNPELIIKEMCISEKMAIKLSKKSGFKPEIIKELQDKDFWSNRND